MSCFWLQFPVPSLLARVLVLVYYLLVSLLSISLNGLVIFLWLRSHPSLLSGLTSYLQIFLSEEEANQLVRGQSQFLRAVDDEQSPDICVESPPRRSIHWPPGRSDIRGGVGGVGDGGHLEHHDPVHGEGLGGVQGDQGQARRDEGVHGESGGDPPVGGGPGPGPAPPAGLQQVRVQCTVYTCRCTVYST